VKIAEEEEEEEEEVYCIQAKPIDNIYKLLKTSFKHAKIAKQ
jgi:hypothetical protein